MEPTETRNEVPMEPEVPMPSAVCVKNCPTCSQTDVRCCLNCLHCDGLIQFVADVEEHPDDISRRFDPKNQRANSVRFWCRKDFELKQKAQQHRHLISDLPVCCENWEQGFCRDGISGELRRK